MTTSIILLLSLTVVVLALLITILIWRNMRQQDELKHKNDVIVREVRRNQSLMQRSARSIVF